MSWGDGVRTLAKAPEPGTRRGRAFNITARERIAMAARGAAGQRDPEEDGAPARRREGGVCDAGLGFRSFRLLQFFDEGCSVAPLILLESLGKRKAVSDLSS